MPTDADTPNTELLARARAGRIAGIHAFLDPAVHSRFALPAEVF